jgi:hypothetical protein
MSAEGIEGMAVNSPSRPGATTDFHNTGPIEEPEIVEKHEEETPTVSHELANADLGEDEEIGAAQEAHGQTEVRDLGWNEPSSEVPNLVGGLPNEELWTLIRRFNKVSDH